MAIRLIGILLTLLVGTSWAQVQQVAPPGTIVGVPSTAGGSQAPVAISPSILTMTAQGGTTSLTESSRYGQVLNVKDYGALGNGVTCGDGVIAASSTAFTSTSCATFTAADVGKTIQIDGASGIGSAPLVTTIAAYISAHAVTLAAASTTATPGYYLSLPSVSSNSGDSGSYIPGETVSLVGGTYTSQASAKVSATAVYAVAQNSNGTGGTTGACVLTGTSGTGPTLFSINATITAGSISALGSIISGGNYLANPSTLAAEPVTSNCGLTGATVAVSMGLNYVSVGAQGAYSVAPTGTIATGAGSSSGATGATFTATFVATGTFLYGTDDTAAFTAAINRAAALYATGILSYVYAPQSNYLINGSTLPTFYGYGGGIVGDGRAKTNILVGASYSGDLFSWSESWLSGSYSTFGGNFALATVNPAGPKVRDLSIYGDRFAAAQQNALVFYDRDDYVDVQNVEAVYMNGRCLYSGVLKNASQSFMRESHITGLRCSSTGNAGIPTIEFNTQGSGDGTNALHLNLIDVYGSYGTGLVIRSNGSAIQGIFGDQIRIEGREWDTANVAADLMVIGDPTLTGIVNNVFFSEVELADPYLGQVAFRATAPSSATQPYQISVSGSIGGGIPLGGGIEVDAGRSLYFTIPGGINTYGKNLIIGSSAGSPVVVNTNGGELNLTTSLGNTTSWGIPAWLLSSSNASTLYAPGGNTVAIGNQTYGASLRTVNNSAIQNTPWQFLGGQTGVNQNVMTMGSNPRLQAIDGTSIQFAQNAGSSGVQGGTEEFVITYTASAVNYPGVTGGTSGNPGVFTCFGTTNTSCLFKANGTGQTQLGLAGTSGSTVVSLGASADQSAVGYTPTTGFSQTIPNNATTIILNPAGTLATGTVTMPAAPVDKQLVQVACSQIISALTVSANSGQTIYGAPTTCSATAGFEYVYSASSTAWFRLH